MEQVVNNRAVVVTYTQLYLKTLDLYTIHVYTLVDKGLVTLRYDYCNKLDTGGTSVPACVLHASNEGLGKRL